jgi:hypothetical protein
VWQQRGLGRRARGVRRVRPASSRRPMQIKPLSSQYPSHPPLVLVQLVVVRKRSRSSANSPNTCDGLRILREVPSRVGKNSEGINLGIIVIRKRSSCTPRRGNIYSARRSRALYFSRACSSLRYIPIFPFGEGRDHSNDALDLYSLNRQHIGNVKSIRIARKWPFFAYDRGEC